MSNYRMTEEAYAALLKTRQAKIVNRFKASLSAKTVLESGNKRGVDVGPAGRGVASPKGQIPAGRASKRSKHGAVKTTLGYERFDSKLEASCWLALKLRETAGEIRNLRRQVKFSLFMNFGEHYGIYTADFVYEQTPRYDKLDRWTLVVADTKSPHTRKLPAWQKVKKLMRNCHSIDVLELP